MIRVELPSWELTYPLLKAFWRWFPFPQVGYVSSLEGIYLIDPIEISPLDWSHKTPSQKVTSNPTKSSLLPARTFRQPRKKQKKYIHTLEVQRPI